MPRGPGAPNVRHLLLDPRVHPLPLSANLPIEDAGSPWRLFAAIPYKRMSEDRSSAPSAEISVFVRGFTDVPTESKPAPATGKVLVSLATYNEKDNLPDLVREIRTYRALGVDPGHR